MNNVIDPWVDHLCTLQHKLPEDGWSDQRIQLLLQELSVMDSNNFPGNNFTC